MADEIRFPLVGEDRGLTRVLKDASRESAVTAAQTRLLADSLKKEERAAFDATAANRVLADSYDKQRRAINASAGAVMTHAKVDKILKDSTDEAIASTVKQRLETDKLAKSAAEAAGKGGLKDLIGGGGIPGGGMGALIAAGAALSPVLVTVGTGLGGLGLAALAAGKNSKQLKDELAPLKTQFQSFGNAVRPTVVADFGAAVRLAGGVLKDIQPVTVATGKAMAQFLGLLGKDLQGKEWTDFFNFMASTAGPDVRMLGTTFIDLANTLPPLLKSLQPVAVDLISIADAATKVVHASANMADSADQQAKHENVLAQTTDMLRTVLFAPGVGLYHALQMVGIISHTTAGATQKVAPNLQDVADNARVASVWTHRLGDSVAYLNTQMGNAIGPNATFNTDLINTANAAHSAQSAMKKTHDAIGLNTQAKRDAASADQGYIDALVTLTKDAGTNRQKQREAAAAIKDALPVLQSAKGGTKAYWEEVKTLISYLNTLRREKTIREAVVVTGTGKWAAFSQSGVGHAVSPGGAATGGFVRQGTTATADDVLARVSKGELIVPSKMVAAGLVDHLRGSIPGFAAGGIVPSYQGSVAGLPPWASHNQQATISAITAGIAKGMASAFASMGAGGAGPARHASLPYLEGLWDRAGGPPGVAHLMAAIAMAESGGSPIAHNPSGASGLWQILGLPFPGNPFDPLTNARMAVAKYRSQGLGAWVTYTSGAYRQFYADGTQGARPGWAWVGERGPELVHMLGGEQVLSNAASMRVTRGYAAGTGLEKALAALTPGSGNLWSDIHQILRQIAKRYSGQERRRLDKLVERQASDIAEVRRHIRAMDARDAARKAYAASVTSGLSGFADLSNMTLGPGYAGGRQLSGAGVLNQQLGGSLSQLRQFGSVLKRLDRLHLPERLLRQIVALGPGPGTQFGQELLSAGPSLLKKISSTERAISAEEKAIGLQAAHDVYGNTSSKALRRQFGAGRGALVNIERMVVSSRTDIEKTAQKLAHKIVASGFGS